MNGNSAIGGYFGLELIEGREFHVNALKLNAGRNALEYILRVRGYDEIFVPYYTCDVILEPINKLNIAYQFYHVDEHLEPVFEFDKLEKNKGFLCNNYFGIKSKYIESLSEKIKNLIVDNAQAFYSLPLKGVDTFYSPRKFFGIPDGAYLYTDLRLNYELEQDMSYRRFSHLLMRDDVGPEAGYPKFVEHEKELGNNDIKIMSKISQKLLTSIDYDDIASKRRKNFEYVHHEIGYLNRLDIPPLEMQVPMIYPLLLPNTEVRNKMIQNRVFTPLYWTNVLKWSPKGTLEYRLARNLVFVPIDQRYSKVDLERVIKLIKTIV